jgi:hypothetical protein
VIGDDRESAEFYQAHKDDPDVWEEPDPAVKRRRRTAPSATLTVRFSPDEVANMRRVAKERGMSYSDVVREAVRLSGSGGGTATASSARPPRTV